MAIRAENDPRFYRRFFYMGLFAIGFALWSLFDGAIEYPHQRQQAFDQFRASYKEFDESKNEHTMSLSEFESQAGETSKRDWEAFAQELGVHSHADIVMQYTQFVVAGLIGLWLVSLPLRARGRWIELDGNRLATSWGQSFNLAEIVAVDKRQWQKKGIARITYNDNGRKRRFVLDDYKFDRHKTDEILYELEQHIDPALLTGGPPESPPDDSHEAASEPFTDESDSNN
jgi:hypothetical protein